MLDVWGPRVAGYPAIGTLRASRAWMMRTDDAGLVVFALGLRSERSRRVRERLEEIGGLHGLAHAGGEALHGVISPRARTRLDAVILLGQRIVEPESLPDKIEAPEDIVRFLGPRIVARATESFWVISLDVRGRPLGASCISEGGLTACFVHPREVFAVGIRARAASIVVAHNHPSGDAEPSPEDIELTSRLRAAGEILGIPLVDHIVIARGGHRSLGGGTGRTRAIRRAASDATRNDHR